jgi:hypothetical protein
MSALVLQKTLLALVRAWQRSLLLRLLRLPLPRLRSRALPVASVPSPAPSSTRPQFHTVAEALIPSSVSLGGSGRCTVRRRCTCRGRSSTSRYLRHALLRLPLLDKHTRRPRSPRTAPRRCGLARGIGCSCTHARAEGDSSQCLAADYPELSEEYSCMPPHADCRNNRQNRENRCPPPVEIDRSL